MSQDKFQRDLQRVRDLSPDEMPAFPHKGSAVSPVNAAEEKLLAITSVKPVVNVTNKDGSIPSSDTDKLVSQEQLTARATNSETPYSEKNPSFFNIGPELPSCMAFYPGNSLCIQTFKTPHIIKMIEAMEMEDFSMMVEVVSSVLEPGFSAFALTVDDFFYCMYWLKINSFKKSTMEVNFTCTNPEHVAKVISQVLPKETLDNTFRVTGLGALNIEYMTKEKLDRATEIINSVKKEYGLDLFPLQMRDFAALQDYLKKSAAYATKIEVLELSLVESGEISSQVIDKLRAEKNALDAQYAMKDYAPYIAMPPGKTIIDKLNFLSTTDLPADFLYEIDEFRKCLTHGVRETVAVGCQECNAKTEVDISVDALHFFPEVVRARFA